jgi:FkbM family methyltransferase
MSPSSSPTMFALRLLKFLAERMFGVKVLRVLPRGIDPMHDLQRLIPKWKPYIFFDVGANVGQSAIRYAKQFPSSRILSFEPCKETYAKLKENVACFPNIECYQSALASKIGSGLLRHGSKSDLHSLIIDNPEKPGARDIDFEAVDVQTIDQFCLEHQIDHVSYLKIDTEGGDFEVLKGAEGFLRNHKVDVIEVELGFSLDNDVHVPFQTVRFFLEQRSYFIFGFYEQVYEWKLRKPHLRRSNVVFISQRLDGMIS